MVHIVRASIQGLAGRKGSVSFEVNRHLLAFWGRNGGGKTSVLKIIAAVLGNSFEGLASAPFDSAEVVLRSEDYDCDICYNITRTKRAPVGGLKPSREGRVDSDAGGARAYDVSVKKSPEKGKAWRHAFLPTSRLLPVDVSVVVRTSLGKTVMESADDHQEQVARMLQEEWSTLYARMQSEARAVQKDALVSILNAVVAGPSEVGGDASGSDLTSRDAHRMVSNFLKDHGATKEAMIDYNTFESRFRDDVRLRSVIGYIALSDQRLAVAFQPKVVMEDMLSKMLKGKKVVATDTGLEVEAEEGQPLRLSQLSSGELQVLCIVVKAIGARGGVVIIDEPELSLHIDWQRDLLPMLRKVAPQSQFIVATHSPELMTCVPEGCDVCLQ